MKKNDMVIIVIAVVVIAIVGFLFVSELFTVNNTTNNTNGTVNFSTTNNNTTTVNNSTVSNQSKNNNPPPPHHDISPEEAKELAKKYVGPGVILEKPVLTTYRSVKAWQVPVYTKDHNFINNIYIDAKTGKKVD